MIPSYFLKFLETPKDELSTFNMVQICSQNIPDDVLERISDDEEFSDYTPNGNNSGTKIYGVDILERIVIELP